MPSIDSYNAATTSVNFAWPYDVTGLERIMLSSQGDLQRLLSAFFSRPITVALVHSHTSSAGGSVESSVKPTPLLQLEASAENPLTQTRQVHLLCASHLLCVATSTVRIMASDSARLFLGEKYAIGQVFRELGRVPRFELVSTGVGQENGKRRLWRKYRLGTEGFECEILEVFPDRDMFIRGDAWLEDDRRSKASIEASANLLHKASTEIETVFGKTTPFMLGTTLMLVVLSITQTLLFFRSC